MTSANQDRAPKRQPAYWRRRELIRDVGLPPADERLLDALNNLQGENAWCWPTIELLAGKLRRDAVTVRKRLAKLIAAGWVIRERRDDRKKLHDSQFRYALDEAKLASSGSGERSLNLFEGSDQRSNLTGAHRSNLTGAQGAKSTGVHRSTLTGAHKDHFPKKIPTHTRTPEAADAAAVMCVQQFYLLRFDTADHKPSGRDIELASKWSEQYGEDRLLALLPIAVKLLRRDWPKGKRFAALEHYLAEASGLLDKQERDRERRRAELEAQRRKKAQLEAQREEQQRFDAEWGPVWEALSVCQRRALLLELDADSASNEFGRRQVEKASVEAVLPFWVPKDRLAGALRRLRDRHARDPPAGG